ncbi:MAG: UxaA family hydrolase [Klebsiella quasipneumoniae]|nr:UxaA family hydrolase [Klebsiella quasipneumoniae]
MNNSTPRALHIHPNDNIAVCTTPVRTGDSVKILEPDQTSYFVESLSDIAFCNKIALSDIEASGQIVKYGQVIGTAIKPIRKGSLVNHENIASQPRSYDEEYLIKEVRA